MADALKKTNAARVRERLSYCAETGQFRWLKVDSNPKLVGRIAGCYDKHGYRLIGLDGVLQKAHRVAWLHFFGAYPESEIDHINGVKDDNRIANLRCVTARVNRENRRLSDSDAAVQMLGVSRSLGKFRATIRVAGKQRHLGCFASQEAAHTAYVAAKRELHEGCTL